MTLHVHSPIITEYTPYGELRVHYMVCTVSIWDMDTYIIINS